MKAKIFLLLLGILIGLAIGIAAPGLRQRLPEGWRPAPTGGVVEEKRIEPDGLLLTLVTPDGAVLATFSERIPEIDLLVAPGDTVSLSLSGYRPFVRDPEIVRVVKASRAAPAAAPPALETPVESPADTDPVGGDDPLASDDDAPTPVEETLPGDASRGARPPAATG